METTGCARRLQKSHKLTHLKWLFHTREKMRTVLQRRNPRAVNASPSPGRAAVDVAEPGRGPRGPRGAGGPRHDTGPRVPCSSRIPLGIFLSPALTTAFRCLLNLRDTDALGRGPGRRPGAGGPGWRHPPGEPGEALPAAHGRAALAAAARAPAPQPPPQRLISSSEQADRGTSAPGTLLPEAVGGQQQEEEGQQQRQQQPGQQGLGRARTRGACGRNRGPIVTRGGNGGLGRRDSPRRPAPGSPHRTPPSGPAAQTRARTRAQARVTRPVPGPLVRAAKAQRGAPHARLWPLARGPQGSASTLCPRWGGADQDSRRAPGASGGGSGHGERPGLRAGRGPVAAWDAASGVCGPDPMRPKAGSSSPVPPACQADRPHPEGPTPPTQHRCPGPARRAQGPRGVGPRP